MYDLENLKSKQVRIFRIIRADQIRWNLRLLEKEFGLSYEEREKFHDVVDRINHRLDKVLQKRNIHYFQSY